MCRLDGNVQVGPSRSADPEPSAVPASRRCPPCPGCRRSPCRRLERGFGPQTSGHEGATADPARRGGVPACLVPFRRTVDNLIQEAAGHGLALRVAPAGLARPVEQGRGAAARLARVSRERPTDGIRPWRLGRPPRASRHRAGLLLFHRAPLPAAQYLLQFRFATRDRLRLRGLPVGSGRGSGNRAALASRTVTVAIAAERDAFRRALERPGRLRRRFRRSFASSGGIRLRFDGFVAGRGSTCGRIAGIARLGRSGRVLGDRRRSWRRRLDGAGGEDTAGQEGDLVEPACRSTPVGHAADGTTNGYTQTPQKLPEERPEG